MKKEEVTNKESEKCKRNKGTIIYIAFIAISITAIVLFIKHDNSVAKTEKISIMPADYIENGYNPSKPFLLGYYRTKSMQYYEFFVEQENGSYKPLSVYTDNVAIVKDLREGQQPYLTRDITYCGIVKNEVLHLPKEVKITESQLLGY